MKKISNDTKTILNMVSNARYAAGNIQYEAQVDGYKTQAQKWNEIFKLLNDLENKMYEACGIDWDEFHSKCREIEEYEF